MTRRLPVLAPLPGCSLADSKLPLMARVSCSIARQPCCAREVECAAAVPVRYVRGAPLEDGPGLAEGK